MPFNIIPNVQWSIHTNIHTYIDADTDPQRSHLTYSSCWRRREKKKKGKWRCTKNPRNSARSTPYLNKQDSFFPFFLSQYTKIPVGVPWQYCKQTQTYLKKLPIDRWLSFNMVLWYNEIGRLIDWFQPYGGFPDGKRGWKGQRRQQGGSGGGLEMAILHVRLVITAAAAGYGSRSSLGIQVFPSYSMLRLRSQNGVSPTSQNRRLRGCRR